jgi:hypothetical protein
VIFIKCKKILATIVLFATLLLFDLNAQAEKIMCISDFQGRGKEKTLELLASRVIAAEGNIDTLVVAGDYIDSRLIYNIFRSNFGLTITPESPSIIFAVGNHDMENRPCGDDYFCEQISPLYPNNAYPLSPKGTFFAYLSGDVLLIVANPFLSSFHRKGFTDRQLDWIEEKLSNGDYRHAFAIGHLPAFPLFRHVGKSLDHYPPARDRFWKILTDHQANYITGHDEYFNIQQKNGTLQLDCGTITGGYGSAIVIETGDNTIDIRCYELTNNGKGILFKLSYSYVLNVVSRKDLAHPESQKEKSQTPRILWGSDRLPISKEKMVDKTNYIKERSLFIAQLNYLLF